MHCKRCGSTNVSVNVSGELKKRSCLSIILWITLAFFTCGLILIIPMLRGKKSKNITWAVCQDCGCRWKV